ncbi:MAG: glycosyltransferase [Chloroflexota bacterium]
MRILTALNIGYPLVGGAQITHQTYLRQLAQQFGHECIYLDKAQARQRIKNGRFLRQDYFRDLGELQQKVAAYQPDILIAGFTLIHDMVKIGRRLQTPVLGWLNSFEYCPPNEAEVAAWQLTQTHRYPTESERRFALYQADQIVANSRFLQQRVWQMEGVETAVIHPPFTNNIILPQASVGKAIVGVCGYPHKGADIFLGLAEAFPNESFLQVGPVHTDYFARFQAQPNITILPFSPRADFLSQAKIVLVPSQWPEPFGRIAVEAMANAIPTIASKHGGLAEIVGDSGQGVADYASLQAWHDALKALLNNPTQNRQTAPQLAHRFLDNTPINQLNTLLQSSRGFQSSFLGVASEDSNPRQQVQLVGDNQSATAFAMINRQIQTGLAKTHTVLQQQTLDDLTPYLPDVVIHHDYSQDFGQLAPPKAGHFVAIRTWDFGRFPTKWVEMINANCDQLWVYSRWTKKQAILSGIPKARVRVIPQGFDPTIFQPNGRSYPLPTAKGFNFLFVGAAVLRKGIDVLLKAYDQAFTSDDDVSLIIKDNSSDVFYEGERWREKIEAMQQTAVSPTIHYIDQFLPAADLAALYRTANVGVFPYRAEGFAMPILEAMACGTPSLVPKFGACLDFCSSQTSFFVPAKRINLPVFGEFAFNTLGFKEEIDEVDFCEVPVDGLAAEMRAIYEQWQRDNGKAIRQRGERGVKVANGRFTWHHTHNHILNALAALNQRQTPVRFRQQRQANEQQKKVFAAARELFLNLPGSNKLPVR